MVDSTITSVDFALLLDELFLGDQTTRNRGRLETQSPITKHSGQFRFNVLDI